MPPLLLLTAGFAERGTLLDTLVFLAVWQGPILLIYIAIYFFIKRKKLNLSHSMQLVVSLLASELLYHVLLLTLIFFDIFIFG